MNFKRNDVSESGVWFILGTLVLICFAITMCTGCTSTVGRVKKDCVCDCEARCGDRGSDTDFVRSLEQKEERE